MLSADELQAWLQTLDDEAEAAAVAAVVEAIQHTARDTDDEDTYAPFVYPH